MSNSGGKPPAAAAPEPKEKPAKAPKAPAPEVKPSGNGGAEGTQQGANEIGNVPKPKKADVYVPPTTKEQNAGAPAGGTDASQQIPASGEWKGPGHRGGGDLSAHAGAGKQRGEKANVYVPPTTAEQNSGAPAGGTDASQQEGAQTRDREARARFTGPDPTDPAALRNERLRRNPDMLVTTNGAGRTLEDVARRNLSLQGWGGANERQVDHEADRLAKLNGLQRQGQELQGSVITSDNGISQKDARERAADMNYSTPNVTPAAQERNAEQARQKGLIGVTNAEGRKLDEVARRELALQGRKATPDAIKAESDRLAQLNGIDDPSKEIGGHLITSDNGIDPKDAASYRRNLDAGRLPTQGKPEPAPDPDHGPEKAPKDDAEHPPAQTDEPTSPPAGGTHRVAEGDTLWGIAEQNLRSQGGSAPDDAAVLRETDRLARENGLTDPDMLKPGTQIRTGAAPSGGDDQPAAGGDDQTPPGPGGKGGASGGQTGGGAPLQAGGDLTVKGAPLDDKQAENLNAVLKVGKEMGASPEVLEAAVATTIQESGASNVNYGDRDSLGLFQQRPSMGWGTPEQVQDPEYAARKFFEQAIPNAKSNPGMKMTDLAQSVQRSGFPDAYAQWGDEAKGIVDAYDQPAQTPVQGAPSAPGRPAQQPAAGEPGGRGTRQGAGVEPPPDAKPAPDMFDATAAGINQASQENMKDAEQFGLDLRKGADGPFSVQAHPDGRAIDVSNTSFGDTDGTAEMDKYAQAKIDEALKGNPNGTKHILYDKKIYGDWNGWKGEPIEVVPGQQTYGEADTMHTNHVHIESN